MYYELLLGIAVLMFLSGVFSASETAMMSLSRAELKRMSGGDPSEKMVCRLLKNPQRLLGTILVGNMFVNVLLASLFATLLEHTGRRVNCSSSSTIEIALASASTASVLDVNVGAPLFYEHVWLIDDEGTPICESKKYLVGSRYVFEF